MSAYSMPMIGTMPGLGRKIPGEEDAGERGPLAAAAHDADPEQALADTLPAGVQPVAVHGEEDQEAGDPPDYLGYHRMRFGPHQYRRGSGVGCTAPVAQDHSGQHGRREQQ